MDKNDNIGARIKKHRILKKWAQKRLGEEVAKSSQVISNWERSYTFPDYEDISKLAVALDISTDYLLGITNNPVPMNETSIKQGNPKPKEKILTWDLLEGLEKADELTFDGHPLNEKQRKIFIDFFKQILIKEDANNPQKNQEDHT
jgi:transcriptional regulator with XRE-family HTH domain